MSGFFLQWWHVGLGLSAFVFAVLLLTVLSVAHQGLPNRSALIPFRRCVTICSYVPFSRWAWFIDFFRRGGILAYMNCSMMAWTAIPNAFLASLWSSSRKSTDFDLLDWRQVSGICVSLSPSIGALRISFEKLPEFLPNSLGLVH